MKRENIARAAVVERELATLEDRMAFFDGCKRLSISSAVFIDLAEYDGPSRISDAFRAVRLALVQMYRGQIHDLQTELKQLGCTDQQPQKEQP